MPEPTYPMESGDSNYDNAYDDTPINADDYANANYDDSDEEDKSEEDDE